jgi:hypothetical protein
MVPQALASFHLRDVKAFPLAKETMSKPRSPVTVTEDGVSARIRKISLTKNATTYTMFVGDFFLLGERKRETRSSLQEAERVALDACRLIAAGRQASLTLTNDHRMN